MTEQIYKVRTVKEGDKIKKVISMPNESNGYYIRRVCQDGAVTFLPVKMPESAIVPPAVPVLEEKAVGK